MSRTLGSWSGMRKYLEREMLADSMKGRVRYNCTTYVGMDDCKIFELFLDGKLYKQFSWETVQSYFHRTGLVERDAKLDSTAEYWSGFWETLADIPVSKRDEYTDKEFCTALEAYRNSDIADSLTADDPIQRMFAVLDRRTGKQSLKKLMNDPDAHPAWLCKIILLRADAEGMTQM
ncbi:SF0329 family protein [Ruminococcus difficilis]|uniref:Uncharacterized protein n=1 Tax=Ruminococcus difficilis TaxID=2763069 RepID=A0A934WUA4_9FIRM|nr:hypothetical protein [Ruminococcus difficilis]MBK6090036.1 hypothetical protein [Ruminococcus difficilis]